jgi:hypothetical protein
MTRMLRPGGRLVIGERACGRRGATSRLLGIRFGERQGFAPIANCAHSHKRPGSQQSRRAAQFAILHPPWRRSQYGCFVSVQQNWRLSIGEKS